MPVLAHAGHQAGVNLELVIFGLGVVAITLMARPWRRGDMRTTVILVGGGAVLAAAALVMPRLGHDPKTTSAAIEIMRPVDGGTVEAREPVAVKVDVANAPLATAESTAGGHLHLYVDGRLEQMPFGTTTRVTLAPGEHEIAVEYVDFDHVSFDPPVRASVEVTAA